MTNNAIFININGIKCEVRNKQTIMQACESYGLTIPHFCFNDQLVIAGNCRMCLVEQANMPKPLVASCAVNVSPNMNIFTNTAIVKKAREGVLEFLLANHPLDCPICDQGGECDLQDQSLVFGGDHGRFYESKRAVEDKNCGPLVKTIMTRCIHCTRCVRFITDIAGLNTFGMTGRGSQVEIGFYTKNLLNSEISGNVIDLCPVGALTSKPTAFKSRSWELDSYSSIDIFDATCSNIKVDVIGNKVIRILPKMNKLVNDCWISDKIRFIADSFKMQRFIKPLIKCKQTGEFIKSEWRDVFSLIKTYIDENKAGLSFLGAAGPFLDLESQHAFKQFFNTMGSNNYFKSSEQNQNLDFRANFLVNTDFDSILDHDFCLFIGVNPRWEAPILNIKLRKLALNGCLIYSLGFLTKSNYYIHHLGNNISILRDIVAGRHFLTHYLLKSKNPLILVGEEIVHLNSDYKSLLLQLQGLLSKYTTINTKFSILSQTASDIGFNELGLNSKVYPTRVTNIKSAKNAVFVYNLANTKINWFKKENFKKSLLIYQGSHGDTIAQNADIILPTALFIEKQGTYINYNGFVQQTSKITNLNESILHSDAIVIKTILEVIHGSQNYKNIKPIEDSLNSIVKLPSTLCISSLDAPFAYFTLQDAPSLLQNRIFDFYLTDSISRSSKSMSACSKTFSSNFNTFC
jgi:NADH-quinone oxidoreductase chain G